VALPSAANPVVPSTQIQAASARVLRELSVTISRTGSPSIDVLIDAILC
jgi:hypothetical protein